MNRSRYSGLLDEIEEVLGARKRLLTTREFALLRNRHYMTVWKWCARGLIPCEQARKGAPYFIHFHQVVDFQEPSA